MNRDFTPAYYQIKQDLKHKVVAGELAAGQLLPGRKAMCDMYGCSWGTINRAVNELILEGVLRAEKGKGTYIADPPENGSTTGQAEMINVWLCHPFPSAYSMLSEMMDGMRDEAHRRGCSIQFLDLAHPRKPEHLDQYIVVTPSNDQWEHMVEARKHGDRFIVLNSSWQHAPFPCIDADIADAVREATQSLIDHGHTNIGLLGIRRGFSNYDRRVEAFRHTLGQAGVTVQPDWITERPEGREAARALYSQWLDDHPTATALFAADYATAMIIFELLSERNIRVPDQLSLLTIGAPRYTSIQNAAVSSIIQPFNEMGRRAVSRMLDDPYTTGIIYLPCRMIVGESVRHIVGKTQRVPG